MPGKIPEQVHSLFWDVRPAQMDLDEDAHFIIERIIDLGDDYSIKWLLDNYSLNQVRQVVQTSRRLSKKTARFWQAFFGLQEEEIRCLTRFYRETESSFWNQ